MWYWYFMIYLRQAENPDMNLSKLIDYFNIKSFREFNNKLFKFKMYRLINYKLQILEISKVNYLN